jgi:hypothetical protein
VNPEDAKESFGAEWEYNEYPDSSKRTWPNSSRAAWNTWHKWIVHTETGEGKSEKIFYNSPDAQSHCHQQLAAGKCAYIIEAKQDTSDVPF